MLTKSATNFPWACLACFQAQHRINFLIRCSVYLLNSSSVSGSLGEVSGGLDGSITSFFLAVGESFPKSSSSVEPPYISSISVDFCGSSNQNQYEDCFQCLPQLLRTFPLQKDLKQQEQQPQKLTIPLFVSGAGIWSVFPIGRFSFSGEGF